jgi:hypothetical protein
MIAGVIRDGTEKKGGPKAALSPALLRACCYVVVVVVLLELEATV